MNRREFLFGAAALAVVPEALARTAGGTPLALVTADLEAKIVALDPVRSRPVAALRTLPEPRSIEPVGRVAVVAHTASGALTLVEPDYVVGGPVLEARRVIRGLGEPRYTAAARDGRHAYVTDSGLGGLLIVDVVRGRVVGRVELGGPARHVSLDPSGRVLWAALGTKAARVAVVDVRESTRPRHLGDIRPSFLAHDVGFTPRGDRVWVTSGDRGTTAIFDRRTGRAVVRLRADAPPQHVAFNGRLAFVTSGDDGTLRTYDASTGRLLRTARIPVGSYNVSDGWGLLFMPSLSGGTLCVADGRGRVRRTVQVARSSHDACFVMGP